MQQKQEKKQEPKWVAGKNIPENMIYACFGAMSNTGLATGLASIEAVTEVGLQKAGIGCLGGLPTKLPPVMGKTEASKKVITVDGCPAECSRKIVEAAGYKVTKSIMLARDVPMKKESMAKDIESGTTKPMKEYVAPEEVKKAKEVIIRAIEED